MRLRQITPLALVLALTVAGFIVARVVTEGEARRDSEHAAEVAAAQIRGRVAQAASLTESLSQYMLNASGTGVTSDQFARNALRWLSPAGFPAAAWVERVRDSRRASYERRIGQPIVTPDERREVVPTGSRSSYLPATLVSGFPPMAVPGSDLSGVPGMARALTRATRRDRMAATPVAPPRTGTHGLFLVAPAPNLTAEVLRPGYVVVFVSDRTLRAAATDAPTAEIATGGPSTEGGEGTASEAFTAAGQRFEVAVPEEPVEGAAAGLPWIILAAGLVLAALAAALGVSAARRATAQADLDRIFNLSPDLIAVADFEGHFKRVNPAVEQVLGYTQEEFLGRPYLDLVHPDDRENTAAEAAAIGEGKKTLCFENRYVRKDGSHRVLEWTSTPVVEDGLMYGMARDVTERRQAETEAERLADEQAALRRVATLVAEDVPASELFEAVASEVGALLGADFAGMARFEGEHVITVGVWAAQGEHPPVPPRWRMQAGDPATTVAETREPARWDDWTGVPGPIAEFIRERGIRSTVGTPIVVEGRVWGALAVHTMRSAPFPPDTEARMAQFTDLVGTAIANADARAEVARLAQEQAALRRVATVVARGASQADVFTTIGEEIGRLFGTDEIGMVRYESERNQVVVANSGAFEEAFPIGSRQPLDGENAASRVFRTGKPVRIDDYATATGPIADAARSAGIRSVVGVPIRVEGRLWGAMITGATQDDPLPPETDARLGQFTELMATAIANTESRAEVDRLAEEQAALRRVATLVASGRAPDEIFAAVGDEVRQLVGNDLTSMFRCEPGDMLTLVAVRARAEPVPDDLVGARIPMRAKFARFLEARRPVRLDARGTAQWTTDLPAVEPLGLRSAIGVPIIVGGGPWGAIFGCEATHDGLPPAAEGPFAQFTELVATAIANAEARAEVERLAQEQAALRRVATLVAEGAPPSAALDAVAGEMEALLEADQVALNRFEARDELLVLAHRGLDVARTPVGARLSIQGESATAIVRRTGRPARMEGYDSAGGALAELARATGLRSSVSAPITVEGGLWGVITASWTEEESPPPDTE